MTRDEIIRRFQLDGTETAYSVRVGHDIITATGMALEGGSRAEAVAGLCDVAAALAAQFIDIRSRRERRDFAEGVKERILGRFELIAAALDQAGANSIEDLFEGDGKSVPN